jgi:hypothetical protein
MRPSTCSISFITVSKKIKKPRRKTNASILLWFKEAKITNSAYINVIRVMISYTLRVWEKNLAGVKITAPEKTTASATIR